MIKYHQAYNSINEIVHINDIEEEVKGKKENYKCISCGNELIPRLGKVNQHHFAHKGQVECSGETYLHKLGKELFSQEYKRCLAENKPFKIELQQDRICTKCENEFNRTCNLEKTTKIFDLIKYFDHIELEKREGSFIPDLKLSGKRTKEKIFIEIAVTHSSSYEKRLSGNKIIEVMVNEEKDLEMIKSRHLKQQSSISFYNFSVKPLKGFMFDDYCNEIFDLFVVFSSGKCSLSKKSLSQIKDFIWEHKKLLLYCHVSTYYTNDSRKFKSLVANAYNQNVNIKNCFICQFSTKNLSNSNKNNSGKRVHPIFCNYLKEVCFSNDAANCQNYRPDKNLVIGNLSYGISTLERLYQDLDGYTEEVLLEKKF